MPGRKAAMKSGAGRLLAVTIAAVLLAASAGYYGCASHGANQADRQREGDDDDTRGEGEFEPGCNTNRAPEILGVTVVVNGEPVATPVAIAATDALQLWMEYRDADCNLDGGTVLLNNQVDHTVYSPLGPDDRLEGMACSSAEAGAPFKFDVDPAFFRDLGGATVVLNLFDDCEAGSESWPLEITTAGD
jgi:hypothetical protein